MSIEQIRDALYIGHVSTAWHIAFRDADPIGIALVESQAPGLRLQLVKDWRGLGRTLYRLTLAGRPMADMEVSMTSEIRHPRASLTYSLTGIWADAWWHEGVDMSAWIDAKMDEWCLYLGLERVGDRNWISPAYGRGVAA